MIPAGGMEGNGEKPQSTEEEEMEGYGQKQPAVSTSVHDSNGSTFTEPESCSNDDGPTAVPPTLPATESPTFVATEPVVLVTITTAKIVVNELLLAKVECIMTKNNPYFFGTISLLKV